MYLSRLILNPRNRRVQREIAKPYQMHRSLMRSFPDGIDRERDRVLFRVDTDSRTGVPTVLLQSTLEPRWDWLENGDSGESHGARGYLLRPPETKEFGLALAPGQTLAFRLRANPTVKRRRERDDGSLRSVRDPLYREQDQRAWLDRKGEQGGFRVLRANLFPEGDLIAWKDNGQRHKLTLFAVRFDGLLQVTDPDRLGETVRHGIGSGKGLGFGLLSLARPSP
jgi:CRISPR system Cascade subunit CasE